MMASVRRVVFASSMLVMALAVPGYSQETTGTILGTLLDQTGGVLPGVKVVITGVDTRLTRGRDQRRGPVRGQPADRELQVVDPSPFRGTRVVLQRRMSGSLGRAQDRGLQARVAVPRVEHIAQQSS
jgi:hypothetical protein